MNENKKERNDEIEIDVQRILSAIWRKAWLVAVAAVVCAVIAFTWTQYFITPLYKSSAMFYVNNNSVSVGDMALSITSSDISASRYLVNSYIVILKTRESLNDVIDYAGVNRSYSELRGMIEAAPVESTEIFEVVVTSPDPYEAEKIADAISYILPKRITSIIEGTSAKIVDSAVVASRPSSPNRTTNTLIGFAVGFVGVIAFIVLREIFDISIRSEEDVEHITNKHPILAAVPDMTASSKGGSYSYYGRGSKKEKIQRVGNQQKNAAFIGNNISFAASEAYKLLRTKLQFSFADDNNNCRVIGLTSALSGEGKSLTAVNLAYTLSQLGKKVVLIDCDMRRPTLAEKLSIQKTPGLSEFLSGLSKDELVCQGCGIKGEEDAFDVIAAGHNPPNPIELLSSTRMTKVITRLRDIYDYIILDLPPVEEVSDALAVAKITDGMLLVVRQNYCNRVVLNDTVRQFEFIGARVLGIVFNGVAEGEGRYGRKYYKKYYKKYNRYGGRYAARSYESVAEKVAAKKIEETK